MVGNIILFIGLNTLWFTLSCFLMSVLTIIDLLITQKIGNELEGILPILGAMLCGFLYNVVLRVHRLNKI